MELHLFVNQERENIFLARQISARQRGVVMAFIPDHYRSLMNISIAVHWFLKEELGI